MTIDEIVQRVGDAIARGLVPPRDGHAAIGAAAAHLSGYPDLAYDDELQRQTYECVLKTAGCDVPWNEPPTDAAASP